MMSALASLVENAGKLFVVHGKRSYYSCGAKALLEAITSRFVLECIEFDDFTENPKKEDVDVGVDLFVKAKSDMIIAVGGGSVMDMAKLIRYYAGSRHQLLAIPTTAGTGAESTQFAVCYINGVKHSISDQSILPDKVILYPAFTFDNSYYLTSCTGFDALAQAIEAYWNINATVESDEFALCAIQQIFPLLNKDILTPTDRKILLKGANDAGQAINITRTTVPHALSYTLTSRYGYPHGHAVALTFPFFFKYNIMCDRACYRGDDYKGYTSKMSNLRRLLCAGDDPFDAMKRYIRQIGLGYDKNRDFDDHIVADGINVERAKNSSIAIDEKVIKEAVKSIRDI